MALIKARCFRDKIVEFEDKGNGTGTCPPYCPIKRRGECYCSEFSYTRKLGKNAIPDIPYQSDTDEAEQRPEEAVQSTAPSDPLAEEGQERPADFFWAEPSPQPSDPSVPVQEEAFPRRGTGASRYNAGVSRTDGIFAAAVERGTEEPCFVDGAQSFYIVRRGAGNAFDAICHIFYHWYTSKVFRPNGKEYTGEFLYLLILCNYRKNEKELTDLINDVSLDINRKFFHLFYEIIFKENRPNGFYWSKVENPYFRLSPKFTDQRNYIDRLLQYPNNVLSDMSEYSQELLAWMQSFRPDADVTLNRYLEQIPFLIAEYRNQAAYVQNGDGLSLVRFGTLREFIRNFPKLESYETMRKKYQFLTHVKILPSANAVKRGPEDPLEVAGFHEDDSVYRLIGIRGASSYCASYYNFYTAILREYVNTFHPDTVTIGGVVFSRLDFYANIQGIVEEAYACMLHGEDVRNCRAKFFLVKSLFERGVFLYYEEMCENERLQELKDLLREQIDPKNYFSSSAVTHKIYKGERLLRIPQYIGEYLEEKTARTLPKNASVFSGDEAIQAYLQVKIEDARAEGIRRRIDEAVNRAEKIIDDQ